MLLISLLFFCVVEDKRNFFSPQILFVGGFILSSLYAIPFVEDMQLDFCADTMLVLCGGITLFVIASLVSSKVLDVFVKRKKWYPIIGDSISVPSYYIEVSLWKLFLLCIFEFSSVVSLWNYLVKVSGTSDISKAMRFWDETNKFTEVTLDKPAIVSLLGMFTASAVYVMLYLLAHQIIYRYRSNFFMLVVNVIIGCINSLLSGGRAGIIGFVFIFVVFLYYMYKIKNNWSVSLNRRVVIGGVVIALGVLVFLYFSAELMGRGKQSGIVHYTCVYLSAELKNLDIFLRKGEYGTDIAHSQTLIRLREYLYKRYGFSGWGTKLDLPFQRVGDFTLGNVYTIFYMFMYDGGYFALVCYTMLMAFISQGLCKWAQYSIRWNDKVNIPLIIYAIVAYAVLFSFFSDKFYELILDVGFIRKLIIVILLSWFICGFKYNSYEKRYVVKYKLFDNKVRLKVM